MTAPSPYEINPWTLMVHCESPTSNLHNPLIKSSRSYEQGCSRDSPNGALVIWFYMPFSFDVQILLQLGTVLATLHAEQVPPVADYTQVILQEPVILILVAGCCFFFFFLREMVCCVIHWQGFSSWV